MLTHHNSLNHSQIQNHDQKNKKLSKPNSSSGSATDGEEVSSEDPTSSVSLNLNSHLATVSASLAAATAATVTATASATTKDMDSIRKTNGSSVLLGALNNSSKNHHHPQYQQQLQQQQQQHQTSKKHHPGYTTRPVRLPLRKHHSFHFQPSQTVAGIRSKHRLKHSSPGTGGVCNGAAAALFLNENSAFKPISPVEHISNNGGGGGLGATTLSSRLVSHELIQGNFDEIKAKSTTTDASGRPIPRICGTSLKRHLSNVESYDSSRYNKQLMHQQHYHQRRIKHQHRSTDEEDDDDDDDDDVLDDDDDEVDSDDEEDDLSSRVPTVNQVVYADVLKTTTSTTIGLPSNINHHHHHHYRDDLAISSDSEMIQQSSQFQRQKDSSEYPNCQDFSTNQQILTSAGIRKRTNSCRSINVDPDYTFYDEADLTRTSDVTIFGMANSPGRQRTTQYVSARNFNEVKI